MSQSFAQALTNIMINRVTTDITCREAIWFWAYLASCVPALFTAGLAATESRQTVAHDTNHKGESKQFPAASHS